MAKKKKEETTTVKMENDVLFIEIEDKFATNELLNIERQADFLGAAIKKKIVILVREV